MSLKQHLIAATAVAFCAVVGSASVSAQENCTHMYRHMMDAYQTQSPHYPQMLNHYNARCLSGGSSQRTWDGGNRDRSGYDRRDHNDDRGPWGR